MDVAEVEGLAIATYRRLGFDPCEPVSTFKIARALLGPQAIERGTLVAVAAQLFTANGRQRIAVSRKLAPEYAAFYVGHELGHVLCDEVGFRGPRLEQVCDQLGAALIAPLPAVAAMVRAGLGMADVADKVVSTQTWAALRLAEVLQIPRAVVTPARVYVRGPEDFRWPLSVRKLAGKDVPGVRKTRLSDDPARVVLDVAC
jgi:hypothetical protein